MRTELDHLLQRLHAQVAAAATLALAALNEAASTVDGSPAAEPDALTGVEEELRECYVQVERDVEVLLARQAPVACDLRHVLALLRINHHVERIGHHAVRVARSTREPNALPESALTAALLRAMADRTLDSAGQAVHALRIVDHGAADALRRLDAEIDTLEGAVAESAIDEFHGVDDGRERVLWVLRAARRLERIGDHAVGIGLRVRDLPTPQTPRAPAPFVSVEL
jgi:phosphate transport system protein